jgi:hypothetical protein
MITILKIVNYQKNLTLILSSKINMIRIEDEILNYFIEIINLIFKEKE